MSCHAQRAHTARPRRRVFTAAAAGSGGALKAWPPGDVWADFAAFHEGAWDSTSCVFARDGTPMPLPDKYTPEAYKEWGQVMHEWQARVTLAAACAPRVSSALTLVSQGEVAAEVQTDGTLRHTLRRWWPTVGCEFGKVSCALRVSCFLGDVCPVLTSSPLSQKDLAETRTSQLFTLSGSCKGVAADGSYWCGPPLCCAAHELLLMTIPKSSQ